ncbi:hypothetical protein AAMO2058_001406000 [Amorphochlora amoebiformis]
MELDEDMPELVEAPPLVSVVDPGKETKISSEEILKVVEKVPDAPLKETKDPKTDSPPKEEGEKETSEKVPVTVVTGWLGSGKTTFLRHVLETLRASGRKIAIIQNEASGVGVEDDLKLLDDDGRPVADLKEVGGGCVCCSVRSDFVAALEVLLKSRRFDHIFLECSGIADPGKIASMFWLDDGLEGGVYLNGVVGIVDARLTNLDDHKDKIASATRNQLAYADVILLNKRDLVAPERIQELRSELHSLNPSPVYVTERSRVENLDKFLDLQAYAPDSAENAVTEASKTLSLDLGHETEVEEDGNGAPTSHVHDEHCKTGCSHKHHAAPKSKRPRKDCVHDESIVAHLFHLKKASVDLEKLRRFLAKILWPKELGGERSIVSEPKVTSSEVSEPKETSSKVSEPKVTSSEAKEGSKKRKESSKELKEDSQELKKDSEQLKPISLQVRG